MSELTRLLIFAFMLAMGLTLSAFVILKYRKGYWFKAPAGDRKAPDGSSASGGGDKAGESAVFVRGLIALWLVVALILFTFMAFFVKDATLPPLADTLVGAIAASTGAAVAYYFSSKAADDTRRDILNAIPGLSSIDVPDFRGKPVKEATAWFAGRNDVAAVAVPPDATPDLTVSAQSHVGRISSGTTVTLTAGLGPVTGVAATCDTSGTLKVVWDAAGGAAGYRVGVADAEDGEFAKSQQTVDGSTVQADVTGIRKGDHWVRVDVFDAKGNQTPGKPIGPVAVP